MRPSLIFVLGVDLAEVQHLVALGPQKMYQQALKEGDPEQSINFRQYFAYLKVMAIKIYCQLN